MSKSIAAGLRYPRLAGALVFCAIFAALWVGGMVATVKPIGGSAAGDSHPSAGFAFKPDAYVGRIWGTRVVPHVRSHSVKLTTVLAAVTKDKSAALARYGHKVAGTYNILVRFTGTVGKLDTSSPIGTMTVNVAGASPVAVKIATGPVILGTTLRDSLKFISFEEFLNQIQFGDVADALNKRVVKDVVAPLDLAKLKGQRVTIYGAWTYDDGNPADITVTPVIVNAGKAPE